MQKNFQLKNYKVIPNLIWNLPLKSFMDKQQTTRVEDPCASSGITLFDKRQEACGFTLIELLVVVLIIGILAAVALPQYQKAVAKAQAANAISILKSVAIAQHAYYMTNGKYAEQLDDLDISVPWTGTQKWYAVSTDTKSNDKFSLQLNTSWRGILIGLLQGSYQGAGFELFFEVGDPKVNVGEIYCVEYYPKFSKPAGSFCQQVMQGTLVYEEENYNNFYKLP